MAGGGPRGHPGYGRLLYVTHGSVGGVVETHLETKKVRTAPTQLLSTTTSLVILRSEATKNLVLRQRILNQERDSSLPTVAQNDISDK